MRRGESSLPRRGSRNALFLAPADLATIAQTREAIWPRIHPALRPKAARARCIFIEPTIIPSDRQIASLVLANLMEAGHGETWVH